MYNEDYDSGYSRERSSEEIYSKPVRAGKRTYFFDVKATKGNNDFYITITESKRRVERDGSFSYDKHKIFLYKEDFDKFVEGIQDAVDYVRKNFLGSEQASAASTPGNGAEKKPSEGEGEEHPEEEIF